MTRTRTPTDYSIETLGEAIAALTARRQELRAEGAPSAELEQNRLELVRLHQELSHALIERYLPAGAERAAA